MAETKICKTCGKELPLSEFCKSKSQKDGYYYTCKTCTKAYRSRPESIQRKRKYTEDHKDEMSQYAHDYHLKNKDDEVFIEYHSNYSKTHPEIIKKSHKKYRDNNDDKIKANRLETRKNTIEYNKKWIKNKRESDINFYIIEKLRRHLNRGLKNYFNKKEQKTIIYLGCTIEELLLYWEYTYGIKLTLDMMGRGKGKWTIDHIKPIDSFDLSNEENIKICFHFTNLQPMLFEENCSKRNNY